MNWTVFLALFLSIGTAWAQHEGAHGGDPLAAEFVARGYYIYAKISALDGRDRILDQAELSAMASALKTTRIQLTDATLYDQGGVVSAKTVDDPLNPGKKLIQLNRPAWRSLLLRDKIDVNRFVFHEYLRAIGKDDDNYKVSSNLDLIDFVPPRSVYTLSFQERVGGEIYTADFDNIPEAKAAALDSYNDHVLNWMADTSTRVQNELGTNVRILDVKTLTGDRTDRLLGSEVGWNYSRACYGNGAPPDYCKYVQYANDPIIVGGGNRLQVYIPNNYPGPPEEPESPEPPFVVGALSWTTGTVNVTFEYTEPLHTLCDQPVEGAGVTYDIPYNPSPSDRRRIASSWAQAYRNYETACQKWKQKINNSAFGKKEVHYADCGLATHVFSGLNQDLGGTNNRIPSTSFSRTYRATVKYTSSGTVYFSSH